MSNLLSFTLLFNFQFRFDLLEKNGCSEELASRIHYAFDKVETMLSNKGTGGRVMSTRSNR